MKEQDIQAKMLKMLQQRGGYVVKIISATKAGVPDILCCYRGAFIGVEVKVGRNKATELQVLNLKAIRKAGGLGGVFYTLSELKQVLDILDSLDITLINQEV